MRTPEMDQVSATAHGQAVIAVQEPKPIVAIAGAGMATALGQRGASGRLHDVGQRWERWGLGWVSEKGGIRFYWGNSLAAWGSSDVGGFSLDQLRERWTRPARMSVRSWSSRSRTVE